jgi:hypothetical protein
MPTIDHISPLPELLDTPIYSFALLLRAPRLGWIARVESALRGLLGDSLEPLPEDAHERPEYLEQMLAGRRFWYLVHGLRLQICGPTGSSWLEHVHAPFPFTPGQIAAAPLPPQERIDADVRRAIESHTAFVGITAESTPRAVVRAANALHCAIAGALWNDDVLVLLETQSGLCYPANGATVEMLADGLLPQLEAPTTQPACEGCVAEARRWASEAWPEFASAFANRTRGDEFFVKHRLGPADADELVWSRVVGLRGTTLTAKLQSEPLNPELGKRGAPQRLSAGDVLDWFYGLPEFAECDGWFSNPAEREHCEPVGRRDDANQPSAEELAAARAEHLRWLSELYKQSELPEPTPRRPKRPTRKRKSDRAREQDAGDGDSGA